MRRQPSLPCRLRVPQSSKSVAAAKLSLRPMTLHPEIALLMVVRIASIALGWIGSTIASVWWSGGVDEMWAGQGFGPRRHRDPERRPVHAAHLRGGRRAGAHQDLVTHQGGARGRQGARRQARQPARSQAVHRRDAAAGRRGAAPAGRRSRSHLNEIFAEDAGESGNATAKALNDRGLPSAGGGKWTARSVINVRKRLEGRQPRALPISFEVGVGGLTPRSAMALACFSPSPARLLAAVKHAQGRP